MTMMMMMMMHWVLLWFPIVTMLVMMVAMVSYFVIALASFVAAMFGVGGGWGFYGVGTLGLLLCIFGVGLAAFSLMLDFEAIKQGVAMGLPERESRRNDVQAVERRVDNLE